MTRLWRRAAISLPLALALVACATTAPTPSQAVTITLLPGTPTPNGATATPGEAPSPTPDLGPVTAEIELTLIGGPSDGSYRAVVHGPACSQPESDGPFTVRYADADAAGGFNALDLEVRDIAAALDDATEDFTLSMALDGATYTLDPQAGLGDGVALLELDESGGATLDVSGTDDDGVEIEASILCSELG